MRESAAFFVLKEDAGDATDGEGIVVAVGGKFTSVQLPEEIPFRVNRLKLSKFRHS